MTSWKEIIPFIDAVRRLLLATPPDFAAARALFSKPDGTTTTRRHLRLRDQEVLVIRGHLVVEDAVALGENAALWVFGDCSVGGALYSHDFDYSLLCVGGRLQAKALRTGGEIFAMSGISAGTLWGIYNDYSTYAPEADCEVYIADDRCDILPQLRAGKQFKKRLSPAELQELFGEVSLETADEIQKFFVGHLPAL